MDISEIIRQNQVLAYILGFIAIAGTIWKVNHALYVKPRDFVIDSLKDDMTRLKGELDEFRRASTKALPEEREGEAVPVPVRLGATAALQNKTPDVSIQGVGSETPLPTSASPAPALFGGALPSRENVGKEETVATPLTSLRSCYEQWKTPSFTDLQKKHFEKHFIGKAIDWDVEVFAVNPPSNGRISVTVQDEGEMFDRPSAIVRFADSLEDSLVSVRKGDRVNVRGMLREFFLWPTVDGTAIRSLGDGID